MFLSLIQTFSGKVNSDAEHLSVSVYHELEQTKKESKP